MTTVDAYYFFAVWGVGLTLGSCLSSCLLKKAKKTINFSYIALVVSLLAIGPSNLLPESFLEDDKTFDDEIKKLMIATGVFVMGLSSSLL